MGRALMDAGRYAQAQDELRAVLQLDATNRSAIRLLSDTQRHRELAEARSQRDQEKAARARARLQQQAVEIAERLTREKAEAIARREAQSHRQVQEARERQAKTLYRQGLQLYRRGQFQAAMDTLAQIALLNPTHAMVGVAQELLTRAEIKLAESRARAQVLGAGSLRASTPVLEDQLLTRRIEQETRLKYAQLALRERHYDHAIDLLQQILADDPQHRDAQDLLAKAKSAKLERRREELERQVVQDEQAMLNDVIEAQRLPEAKPVRLVTPPDLSAAAASDLEARLQQPISFDFAEVALGDVLDFMADAASVSIIPSPQLDLQGQLVSLKVKDLPLVQALKFLAKSQSLAYRVERDAVVIATPEEFSNAPLETRVLYLWHGLGPFTLEAAALELNPAMPLEPLKDLIERLIPQPSGSKLVFDERNGAMVVTNTPENLQRLADLLRQLDVTPTQVLIEARFVEVSFTELQQLGIEAALTGNYVLDKKGSVFDSGEGQGGAGIEIASGSGFKFPDPSRQDEALNLTLQGVLTGAQFEAVLHLLEESKKSKTLSAPRVTALNHQTSVIRVVEEFRFPTRFEVTPIQFDINGDGDFDDAGETEFANVPQDFQERDIGILLSVTPSVGKDLKSMTLVLSPEVSSFSDFRELGGGVTVPEFTSKQLTTSVLIEDGQTVVLGGLMQDATSDQLDKVPWLGDLPFVGGMFRQRDASNERKNLLIFVTVRILASPGPTT